MTYTVEITYRVYNQALVEANSLEEAIEKVRNEEDYEIINYPEMMDCEPIEVDVDTTLSLNDNKIAIISCYNIEYDTEGEEVELPDELTFEVSEVELYEMDLDMYIADLISDETGWCVNSFDYDIEIKNKG